MSSFTQARLTPMTQRYLSLSARRHNLQNRPVPVSRGHDLSDDQRQANIFALDNRSPVSRVAVFIKAGSRYEPDHLPGISHYIRASAGLTTRNSSVFGIARHMERAGASFKVTSNREYIIYRVDCLREKLGNVLGFIDDTIHQPEYRAWELVDYVQPRLREELKRYKANQSQIANEAMHKAAYRGGLAHSVFIPEHQIEKISKTDLFEFFENNYVLDRMSFVGLGVDEAELSGIINEQFALNGSKYKGVSGEARYIGGEARIQAGFPHTLVNFVVQGSPITDLKGLAALEVIGSLLGSTESAPLKYGTGAEKTLPNLLKSISPQFKSSVININYNDTGLFGFSLVGPNVHLKLATKAAVKNFKQILANLKDSDLKNAKRAAKVRSLIQSEDQDVVFNVLGHRHAAGQVNRSPLDQIETLTLQDVQTVAANIMKSKPTLVAVGNPRFAPYVDELD